MYRARFDNFQPIMRNYPSNMATATRRLARRQIRESAPLKGRVDREAGIIYGCKIVGRHSPNTHGVSGVDGTDYTIQALREALPLYEGINVNVDHPERSGPPKDRSSDDRCGKLRNCKATDEGIFGDLYLLKTHPMAERLMEAAEKMPDLFALSHNAYGRGDVQGSRYVITAIPEVRSVDIVADGGTNRSLFEGLTVKTTLRKLIEGSPHLTYVVRRKLLEMGAYCGEDDPAGGEPQPMMDAEMEAPEEGGGDWKEHLTNAIGALVQDESPESHDIAMKIMKLLGPEKPKKKEGPAEESDEEEEEGGEEEESKKKTEEANRRNRALCKLAGVEPDTELLESLAPLSVETASNLISRLTGGKGKPANGVRSAPAGSVQIRESKVLPKTREERLKALMK